MREKKQLFTSTRVSRAILYLAVPTILSQLITVVYNMADIFFLGRLGDPNQVAAATLAMPIFMLLTAFANLFGIGGASLVSRMLGVSKTDKARNTAAFSIWSAILVSFFYGILIFIIRPWLLPFLGANQQTYQFVSDYVFWTVCIGAIPTVLSSVLSHLVRSEGYSKEASFGIAMGGILNIILDPIFIFGFNLEIKGAAIATLLSNVIAMLYFFIMIYKNRQLLTVEMNIKHYSLGEGIPKEVLTVGVASFIVMVMGTISNTGLNVLISNYSNAAVAGIGIAKKINILAFCLAQGLTQGTLPLIGYNFASGNRKRMMEVIKTLTLFSVLLSLFSFLALYFGASSITRVFIDHPETVTYGQQFLKIVSFSSFTISLNFLVLTIFQATGKKIQPLILSLLRKGTLDVPLMVLFDRWIGIYGIAAATPVADFLGLIIAACFVIPYLKVLKNHNRELKVSEEHV